jgi:hypothetical protein
MHNGPAARPNPDGLRGFMTTVIADPFTNMNNMGYNEDPFERAQDMGRDNYAK